MRKIKNQLTNLFNKVKRLFKSPSQFLVALEKGEVSKPYNHYYYTLLNAVDSKKKALVKVKKNDKNHEKIRERMLELANIKKTKYEQNVYTKNFFDILDKSEKVNLDKSEYKKEFAYDRILEANNTKTNFLNRLQEEINKNREDSKLEK